MSPVGPGASAGSLPHAVPIPSVTRPSAVPPPLPADADAWRAAVVATSNACAARGLQAGDGGNNSVRLPGVDLMAVKAAGASFTDTGTGAAVVADFAGRCLIPGASASKEALLHGAIYARFEQVGAIVHCHSPWATAWACAGRVLPTLTYHGAMKLGGEVAVFDTGTYQVGADHLPAILDYLAGGARVFLLARHGQVACGRDLATARALAELVEETAQIAILTGLIRPTS